MKVYLDDERIAPDGWRQVRWPEEVIELLETGEVTELSLDHDLGDDDHGTGMISFFGSRRQQQSEDSGHLPSKFILQTHLLGSKWSRVFRV